MLRLDGDHALVPGERRRGVARFDGGERRFGEQARRVGAMLARGQFRALLDDAATLAVAAGARVERSERGQRLVARAAGVTHALPRRDGALGPLERVGLEAR